MGLRVVLRGGLGDGVKEGGISFLGGKRKRGRGGWLVLPFRKEGLLLGWWDKLAAAPLDRPEVRAVEEHGTLEVGEVRRVGLGLGEKHLSLNEVSLLVHVGSRWIRRQAIS